MNAPAKKSTTRRQLPKDSTTTVNDPGQVVQETEGVKIRLGLPDPQGEKITVIVPKEYRIKRDDGTETIYQPGVQEMLEVDAMHWWSQANGVKIYTPDEG